MERVGGNVGIIPERQPMVDRFLRFVLEFVDESLFPVLLVSLDGRIYPQEQVQVLRELTEGFQALTQEKDDFKVSLVYFCAHSLI